MNRAIQPRETMLEIVSISIPILALIVGSPAPVDGRTIVPDLEIAEPVGQTWLDYARPPIGTLGAEEGATQRVPGDTLTFGFVDDDGFAVLNGTWTFDHGSSDPLEGWVQDDITEQEDAYFRQIDATIWEADPWNTVDAPVLRGLGSAWVGAFGSEARDLCWTGGLGYGNDWRQRLVSPVFTWDGSTDVDLTWVHFYDLEENFEYSLVYLRTLPSGTETELRRYTNSGGLAPDHPANPPVGLDDSLTLTAADFQGETEFQILFVMTSDGSWSDEDGLYPVEYGPVSIDDVMLAGVGPTGSDDVSFGFETDLEGWTAEAIPGIGEFTGVAPLSDYGIDVPCGCELDGNVLELHAGVGPDAFHPVGQRQLAISPPVDVLSDVTPFLPADEILQIDMLWDQYSDMPRGNGVFYRPGAMYYPWTCPVTGDIGWSGRVGQNTYFFAEGPTCTALRADLSVTDVPVPPDAELVRVVYEVFSSCDAFGIPPEQCTGMTNASPLVDNVQIRFTSMPDAPPITIDAGTRYQDGYPKGSGWSMTDAGNSNVIRNVVGFGNSAPFVLGDSLAITGPVVTTASTRWESKLWFRLPRVSPLANTPYRTWRDRVADGFAIDPELAGDGPIEFTWAYMDSCQQGTNAWTRKACSYFREDDDDFDIGSGELSDGNEILPDGILLAGTQVEYFITASYLDRPQYRTILPDTAGGYFLEFEILPRVRMEGSHARWPTVLYVDADEAGAQDYIEEALNRLGIDHDRYDYGDPTSNWKAPFALGGTGLDNNGINLGQLLQYSTVLVNTGSRSGPYLMWPEDFSLLNSWLQYEPFYPLPDVQHLILNGDDITARVAQAYPALLTRLEVSVTNDSYRDLTGDDADCVGVTAPDDAYFPLLFEDTPYELTAYGNACPELWEFDVLAPAGPGGHGNRYYRRLGSDDETAFQQVVRDALGTADNFRSVVDGVSWHHLASPGSGGDCDPTFEEVVQAIVHELGAEYDWLVNGAPSSTPPVDGTQITTQLLDSRPNPFRDETRIAFRLAAEQNVEITIFDATGRRIRRLLDEPRSAGAHNVVWDGRNDAGGNVPSGLYWYRIETDGYERASRILRIR